MNKMMSLFVVFLLVLSPFSLGQIEIEEVSEDVPDCNWWCKTVKFFVGDSEARALAGTAWFDRNDGLPLATGLGSYASCSKVTSDDGYGGFCTVTKGGETRIFHKQLGPNVFKGVSYNSKGNMEFSEDFFWFSGNIGNDLWESSTTTEGFDDFVSKSNCGSTGTCTNEGMNAWDKWKDVPGAKTNPQTAIDYEDTFDGDVDVGAQFVQEMGNLGLSNAGSLKLYEKTSYNKEVVKQWAAYYSSQKSWMNTEDTLFDMYEAFDGNLGHAKKVEGASGAGNTVSEMQAAYDAAGKDPDLAVAVIEGSGGKADLAATHLKNAKAAEGKTPLNPKEKLAVDVVNAAKAKTAVVEEVAPVAETKKPSEAAAPVNPLAEYGPKVLQTKATEAEKDGDWGEATKLYEELYSRAKSDEDKTLYGHNLINTAIKNNDPGLAAKIMKDIGAYKTAIKLYEENNDYTSALAIHYELETIPSGCEKGKTCKYGEYDLEIGEDGKLVNPIGEFLGGALGISSLSGYGIEVGSEDDNFVYEQEPGTTFEVGSIAQSKKDGSYLIREYDPFSGELVWAKKGNIKPSKNDALTKDKWDQYKNEFTNNYFPDISEDTIYSYYIEGKDAKLVAAEIVTSYNQLLSGTPDECDGDCIMDFAKATDYESEIAASYMSLTQNAGEATELAQLTATAEIAEKYLKVFSGNHDNALSAIEASNGNWEAFKLEYDGLPEDQQNINGYLTKMKGQPVPPKLERQKRSTSYSVVNVQVPAKAVTGATLFGEGAGCKKCKYWKSEDGKYYRQNEDGIVVELTGTSKNQLIAKGKDVPTLTTITSDAPVQAAAAKAATLATSETAKLGGWGEVFGIDDSVQEAHLGAIVSESAQANKVSKEITETENAITQIGVDVEELQTQTSQLKEDINDKQSDIARYSTWLDDPMIYEEEISAYTEGGLTQKGAEQWLADQLLRLEEEVEEETAQFISKQEEIQNLLKERTSQETSLVTLNEEKIKITEETGQIVIPDNCEPPGCVIQTEAGKETKYWIENGQVFVAKDTSGKGDFLPQGTLENLNIPEGAGFATAGSGYQPHGTSGTALIALDNGYTIVAEAPIDKEKGFQPDPDKQMTVPSNIVKKLVGGEDGKTGELFVSKEGIMTSKIGDEELAKVTNPEVNGEETNIFKIDYKGEKADYYNGNNFMLSTEDGKSYKDSSNRQFEVDETSDGVDKVSGTCKKQEACFKSGDDFYKGISIYDPKQNWFADEFGAMDFTESSDGERTETWLFKIGNVEYEGTSFCKGGEGECDESNIESDVLEEDGYYLSDTNYGEDKKVSDDDVRTYETRTVGLFRYIDAGVGYGNCGKQNPKMVGCEKNIFFTPDNNEIYNCEKGKSREECAQTSKKFSNDAAGYDELCDGEDKCKADVDKRASSRTLHRFFAGDTEWQQTGAQVYDLLDLSGWNSISMALLGDSYATELASEIDQWFAGTVLDERFYSSAICYALESYDVQGTDYAYIETPGGSFQAVASIQAEKTLEKNPMLCVENEEGGFYCPSKLYCNEEDMFCYEDEYAEEPTVGYFYKITWGVSAPFDESLTPYSDEDGAISFNVYIGEKPVYSKSVHLDNGETDGDKINHYSATEYKIEKICIKWFKAPLTASRSSGFDFEPNAIGNVCTKFKKSTKGSVDYDYGSSGESTSVSGGDVKRKQDW
ncbi:hypothetical protein HOE37_03745 [Candidatus Woesearchaeota archaeon]|jgi:hypothetical protein|nr:hypothetical protein [Candidatus Woesearchaeota archaeon]MBT4469707.1 hypothetical protein [Candidatus Woesearchaeota archaeon]MBT6744069.1 hypothetical protein [Candidatus Woesearchaeota archaeon]